MEEQNSYTLTLKTTTGDRVTLDVLDIIDSKVYNKSFIIYTLTGDPNQEVIAGILNESDTTYSIGPIESAEEINYIRNEIDRVLA